ncbi:hypothetical protein C8R45DRAFT_1209513 [Mycena sanguinolenta]|nr:hypothetical protein C8R45DRAFT_1209513 [Mycena sanguinolenta]
MASPWGTAQGARLASAALADGAKTRSSPRHRRGLPARFTFVTRRRPIRAAWLSSGHPARLLEGFNQHLPGDYSADALPIRRLASAREQSWLALQCWI